MQQRVAIARALVSRPELLLLDEPFASVDALTRAELQDVLLCASTAHRRTARVTIVHVTHDIDEAVYLGDRVLVLGGAPGAVVGAIDVALPRPRSQTATRSCTGVPRAPERAARIDFLAQGRTVMTVRAAVRLPPPRRARAARGRRRGGARRVQGAAWRASRLVTLALEPGAVVFYAKAKGFFARQGLDVKVQTVSDPATIVPALLAGDAQFAGFNVGGAAIAKSRNLPVRLIAGGAMYRRSAPASGLVAAPGRRITRARDLVGKTVAIDGPARSRTSGCSSGSRATASPRTTSTSSRWAGSRRCSARCGAVRSTPRSSPSRT